MLLSSGITGTTAEIFPGKVLYASLEQLIWCASSRWGYQICPDKRHSRLRQSHGSSRRGFGEAPFAAGFNDQDALLYEPQGRADRLKYAEVIALSQNAIPAEKRWKSHESIPSEFLWMPFAALPKVETGYRWVLFPLEVSTLCSVASGDFQRFKGLSSVFIESQNKRGKYFRLSSEATSGPPRSCSTLPRSIEAGNW